MTHFHRDYETRSVVDLKKTGVYRYMQHPTTSVWCMSHATDDGPVGLWQPGQAVPGDMLDAALDPSVEAWAHNENFEAAVERYLGPRYALPEFDPRQKRCTMVSAYAMALPGSLDQLAPAIGIEQRKDAAGGRLMLQMARPRAVEMSAGFDAIPFDAVRVQEMDGDGWEVYETAAGRKLARVRWWNTPEKVERLLAYCAQDTETERAIAKMLRPLKASELDLWHLDQAINLRGVGVDRDLANAAKQIVAGAAKRLDDRMADLTNYSVSACSNRNQLIAWLRAEGVDAESVAKDQVEELLARNDLSSTVREVLEIRRQAARASVAKIDALLNGCDEDGRARGLLQFHAASTGRWAGRRFQPQNIKRPELDDIDSAIAVVATGDIDMVDMLYDDPLNVVADTLRGMIVAAPGRKIVAADYANIEGRVLSWLAGEEWKVKAYRAYDTFVRDSRGNTIPDPKKPDEFLREGPDLYKVAYARSYAMKPEDVTKPQRQIGKVMELALGYQGGVGAFATMGVNYGVRLPEKEVEAIRDAWRAAHPKIKQFWWDVEAAAIEATENPGRGVVVNGKVAFKRVGSFLFMQLPSKRFLAYAYPEIRPKVMPWTDANGERVVKHSLSYMGVNSYTRKWERGFAYGGLLVENATQAVARDVLADAMPRLEAAGYPIILTVHDEIVCEPAINHGSAADMEAIMCELPEWAFGLPVAAEGFEDARYRK